MCASNKDATYMPICQLLLVQVCGNYVHIYTSYELTAMNKMILNKYASQCTCIFHCTSTVVYTKNPRYCLYPSKINKL